MRGLEIEVLRKPAGTDHDRLCVHDLGTTVAVALADGAGGLAHARRAAERAVEAAHGIALAPLRMYELDAALHRDGGETTLVVVACARGTGGLLSVRGVSVGDSRAWAVLADGHTIELTEGQSRKRLGSRRAVAHCFARTDVLRVIAASDGLIDAVGEHALVAASSLAPWRTLRANDDATGVLVSRSHPSLTIA